MNLEKILTKTQRSDFHIEIAARLLDRLTYIKIQPKHIMDFGYQSGYVLSNLSVNYPNAKLYGLNISSDDPTYINHQNNSFIYACHCEADALPLASHSVDLIISNLSIDFKSVDLNNCFKELYRLLKPSGLLLFSMELNSDHFIEIGNMLVANQFCDPVLEQELITVNYQKSNITHADDLDNFPESFAGTILYGHAVRLKAT